MKQNRTIVFSWILLIGFLIPMSISFVHSFEKHEHTVCDAKNIKHFHKVENDCNGLHYFVPNFNFFAQVFNISFKTEILFKVILNSSSDYLVFIPFKSSRAPPVL